MEGERLSKWDTYCFLMNAIVGGGIYAIPKAFQSAGILISLVILGFMTLVSWLVHIELLAITDKLIQSPYVDSIPYVHNIDNRQLVPNPQAQAYQWDLPAIFKALFKDLPALTYIFFLWFILCMVGTLTVYTNMFGTAFGSWFECDSTEESEKETCLWKYYRIGTYIFFVLIGALTLIEYKAQARLQYIMTGLQFAILIFVISYSMKYGNPSSDNLWAADFPHACSAFSVLNFAYLYHICIPSVIAAARGQHREQKEVAIGMTVSIGILYGLIGTISSLCFKELPENFSLFFDKYLEKLSAEQIPYLFPAFAFLAIHFPAIDIISNSSIYGQSLAGVFVTFLYGTNHRLAMNNHRLVCKLIRVLCVVPPLICAHFSRELVCFT